LASEGEGNLVEQSERYASVAKPEGPKDINGERGPLVGEVQKTSFQTFARQRTAGEAQRYKMIYYRLIFNNYI
jgi:hypothetical protein